MTTKKENDEQPITDISIYVAALSSTYRPASTPAEATHFFSTPEVIDAIRNLDPSAKVCAEQITKALLDAGYKFCNRPGAQGLEFKWMFREL
jgi:tonB family protein